MKQSSKLERGVEDRDEAHRGSDLRVLFLLREKRISQWLEERRERRLNHVAEERLDGGDVCRSDGK